jgi:hypothetical protein
MELNPDDIVLIRAKVTRIQDNGAVGVMVDYSCRPKPHHAFFTIQDGDLAELVVPLKQDSIKS